jgi:hypothetical protein
LEEYEDVLAETGTDAKGWRILVSAEKLDGLDALLTKVEKSAWQPEQICWSCPDTIADGGRLKNVGGIFPFKPP